MRRFLPLLVAAFVVSSTAFAAECVPNDVAVNSITEQAVTQFGHPPEILLHYTDAEAAAIIKIAADHSPDEDTRNSIAQATSVDVYVVKSRSAFINFRLGDCTQGGASMDLETFIKLIQLVEKSFT